MCLQTEHEMKSDSFHAELSLSTKDIGIGQVYECFSHPHIYLRNLKTVSSCTKVTSSLYF